MQKNSFTYEELIACGKGELFGEGNAKLPLPPMLMFDRITRIDNKSGEFKKAGHLKEILIKEGKNYFDTNTTLHHHFYDEINNELTDIENNKIELKKFPAPPKGKSIKNVNVIINIDNDNQKH